MLVADDLVVEGRTGDVFEVLNMRVVQSAFLEVHLDRFGSLRQIQRIHAVAAVEVELDLVQHIAGDDRLVLAAAEVGLLRFGVADIELEQTPFGLAVHFDPGELDALFGHGELGHIVVLQIVVDQIGVEIDLLDVITLAAIHQVRAVAVVPDQEVIPVAAEHLVIALVADNGVVAGTSIEVVFSITTLDSVFSRAAKHCVFTEPACELVIAKQAKNEIVPTFGAHFIIAERSYNEVVLVRAVNVAVTKNQIEKVKAWHWFLHP